MSSLIKYIADLKPSHLLIMADFNLREIIWSLGETSVGEEHTATLFLESTLDSYQQDTEMITFQAFWT